MRFGCDRPFLREREYEFVIRIHRVDAVGNMLDDPFFLVIGLLNEKGIVLNSL
jgi:hypothetical protein